MKKIRRNGICFILSVFLLTLLSGCSASSSKAFTFSVDTGDSVQVRLDTSDGYDLSSDVPFVISHEEKPLSQGAFMPRESYEQFVVAIESDENAVLLDSGTKDGNDYIFWSYNDSEFDYAILIDGSNTGIVLGNIVSQESAVECFNRLTVSAE